LPLRAGSSRPARLGVKEIVKWLNSRGYCTRRGKTFGVGTVYKILTNTVYVGRWRFNQVSSRTRRKKGEDEVIEIPVPAIIEADTFEQVQRQLHDRSPKVQAPRKRHERRQIDMDVSSHTHPGASRPLEHPCWNLKPAVHIGTAQSTTKNNLARPLDSFVNANPKAKPWMPPVQQFAKLSSVGLLKPRCTIRSGPRITRLQTTSTRAVCARASRVAGYATSISSADHAGAQTNLKLIFRLDHPAGGRSLFAATECVS